MLNVHQIPAPTTNVFGLMATPAALAPCLQTGQHRKPRVKAGTTIVNVAIGRSTNMPEPCEFWATTDTDYDYGYGYEAIYDPKQISLADAEKWVRNQLAEQGVNVGQFINEDTDDDTRTTALAAALYIARYAYGLATASPDPAARLDDMCDAVAEAWDDITPKLPKKFAGKNLEFAETMRAAVADRLWAFAAVEHARAEVDAGYEYVFDILADNVRHGRDPQDVRAEVPRVVERLRADRILGRLWEARDAAEGPWAEILDIVLDTINEGADPQAVVDQVAGLMAQARAEKTAGASR